MKTLTPRTTRDAGIWMQIYRDSIAFFIYRPFTLHRVISPILLVIVYLYLYLQTVYIQSSLSSTRLEDIASTAPDAVRWMQIAFSSPKNMSLDIARRAEAAGCR